MIRSTTLRSFLFATVAAVFSPASASHLCGGDIFYTLSPGGNVQIELHVYGASNINGSNVGMNTGDGGVAVLSLDSIQTLPGFCCNYRFVYSGSHVYAQPGSYTLEAELSLRSGDILNIPNPSMQSLCLNAEVVITDMNAANTSVRFTNAQPDVYYVGNTLVHDVDGYDADGDSLTFNLGIPLGNGCAPVNPYSLPFQIGGGNDTCWLDANGTFNFQDPWLMGAHSIVIRCSEWRNGVLMGRVRRDMKLCINTLTDVHAHAPAELPLLSMTSVNGVYAFTLATKTPVAVDVWDTEGRQVRSAQALSTGDELDLRALVDGAYVVRSMDATGASRTQRVVLTR
jgi:hypothetical protein